MKDKDKNKDNNRYPRVNSWFSFLQTLRFDHARWRGGDVVSQHLIIHPPLKWWFSTRNS